MGCWFAIEGSVKVRDNTASRAILKELQDTCGEIGVAEEKGISEEGTIVIVFSNGEMTSHSNADKFSSLVQSLGPHAVEAACLMEEVEAERGELWVGSNSQVKEGKRLAMVQEARFAIKKLVPEDRKALLAEFQE